MPVAKKVISYSTGNAIPCCWFECGKSGYELYKSILHEHTNVPCDHPTASHVAFIFCSERHKQLYLNSHRDMGNLPAGYRKVI